jgi:hypothetical protein
VSLELGMLDILTRTLEIEIFPQKRILCALERHLDVYLYLTLITMQAIVLYRKALYIGTY